MATDDEHQLFETALAATMNQLDLAFHRKDNKKNVLETFLCKKELFCCFANWVRQEFNLPVSCAGSSGPCVVVIGCGIIQLRAVRPLNGCLVPPLQFGPFHHLLPGFF